MATVSLETSFATIPHQVWDFYDPNHALAPLANPEGALLSWLDEKREQPLMLPHIGAVATRRLVAMELAHIGIIDQENTSEHSDWLGITPSEIEQSVVAAHAYAYDTVKFCKRAIMSLRISHPSIRDTSDIILGGAVLSAHAHAGEWRLNGQAYYTHPRDVGLLLQTSAQLHFPKDLERQHLETFGGQLHDGLEHALDKKGRSFLGSPRLIPSPLVISHVLQSLGADRARAQQEAQDAFVLAKSVGPNGTMAWDIYINRFSTQPSAIPKKLSDLRHNRDIDPKIAPIEDPEGAQKVRDSRNNYKEAQHSLLSEYDRVDHPDPIDSHLFAAALNHLTVQDLRNAYERSAWAKVSGPVIVKLSTR